MRFQVTLKLIRPNSWITQTVRQRIPNCWARNGESTSAESDALPPTRPGQLNAWVIICRLTSANRLLRWTAANCRHSGWPGPVGTHSPATCDVCCHVLPGKTRELRHGTWCRTSFQLPTSLCAINKMFSLAAFFTARMTLCVIRYDHLATKLGPDVEELIFNHQLWTLISDA